MVAARVGGVALARDVSSWLVVLSAPTQAAQATRFQNKAETRARSMATRLRQILARIAAEEAAIIIRRETGLAGMVATQKAGIDDLTGELLSLLVDFGLRQAADAAGIAVGGRFDLRGSFERRFIEAKRVQVQALTESTRQLMEQKIRSVLRTSLFETPRPSPGELARRLQREIPASIAFNGARAERVARTETAAAMNAGARHGMLVAGVVRQKWIAIQDGRGRHGHVDGMVVDIGKPFVFERFRVEKGVPVGTGIFVELLHPGDPTAEAEDIINCRCTIVAAA